MGTTLRKRQAARAILLTPDHHILLIQSREPQSGLTLWATPGGGIEDGEMPAACLQRELYEETGLQGFEIGPHVWTREHIYTWGEETIDQQCRYYLIHIAQFQPTMRANPEQVEIDSFLQFRWWALQDILKSDELFVPGKLGEHLNALIQQGPPLQPLTVGV